MGVSQNDSSSQKSEHFGPPFQVSPDGDAQYKKLADGVEARERFYIDVETSGYRARIRARINEQREAECTGLSLDMFDGTPVNWQTLRYLPLDGWLRDGLALVSRVWDNEADDWYYPGTESPSEARNEMLRHLRTSVVGTAGGRRPLSDDFLREVAAIYTAGGRQPIAALRAKYPHHSRDAINKWVRRAREQGFIKPAKYDRKERNDAR